MDNELVKKVLTEATPYVPTSQPGGNGKGILEVQLIRMSDVVSKKLQWLWPGRIPYFMLSDLQGDPGEGKSHIGLAISSAISLGHGLPGMPHCEPGNVLIAGAEDPLDYTVKPRLEAMGADSSKIYSLKGMFTLDLDGCQLIENYINQTTPKLVIIDPLIAYMSAGLDINKSNQVRQVTARLSLLAEKYHLAVLTVRH